MGTGAIRSAGPGASPRRAEAVCPSRISTSRSAARKLTEPVSVATAMVEPVLRTLKRAPRVSATAPLLSLSIFNTRSPSGL